MKGNKVEDAPAVKIKHYRFVRGRIDVGMMRYCRGRGFVKIGLDGRPILERNNKMCLQWGLVPTEMGGRTTASVIISKEDHDFGTIIGVAECSQRDHFCYKMGSTIALGRLAKTLARMGLLDRVVWPVGYISKV